MELALSLEKVNYAKLKALDKLAVVCSLVMDIAAVACMRLMRALSIRSESCRTPRTSTWPTTLITCWTTRPRT
jgi:hypothetical protein